MTVVGQQSLMHQAWNLLIDESATSIAILGPGGIGKTTLMKQLYHKLITTKHFDTVIWITVSSKLTLQKIQDDISKCLGLFDSNWTGKSFDQKSDLIREQISGNKFVLFLDDLWFHLDLRTLGVEGCKFIYSTRFSVVPQHMGAYTVFTLKELSGEDAWELFRSKVGDDTLTDLTIMEIARNLVSKCNGLPILISTLGRAMSFRKTREEWEYALQKIEKDARSNNSDQVTCIFKLCFDSFPNAKIRSCLSYFSLFPEDFTILKKDLIDFWICENILGIYGTRVDPLIWGYNAIHTLTEAGFLEEENDSVKLLDMIRDFALSRVKKSQLFRKSQLLVNPPYDGPKWTDSKVIRKCGLLIAVMFRFLKGGPLFISKKNEAVETIGWISSMGNSIGDLLVNVPTNLFTFLLNHNPFIMIKPAHSSSMYKLTVLDLSNSGIEEVPRDISRLVSLQYLNLSYTWIEWLPIELKMLTKLKCLNLEYDDQLRVIPKELISSLRSLRVLKIFRCGFSVEEVESNILSLRNMDINPLLSLKHLKVLSITITSASALHELSNNPTLLNCTQSLSLEVFWRSESLDITPLAVMKYLLTLEIHQAEHLKEFNGNYSELLGNRSFERLREVTFEKCLNLQELTWVILVPNLTILRAKSCEQVQEIISSRRLGEIFEAEENLKPFTKLEILSLDSLPELNSIYWRALPFQSLKKMEIIDCSLLKKLPLNSTITKGNAVMIEAEEEWWKNVEWEDEAAKTTFLPCFKPLL
ncbi:putative disease resistance protein At4g10780 [Euphorbia lathyris]|uniref:putative disease resistance protein At4g10780 n=1 Tax=Euphorbia lathyris TaxID=212925 RepID=UPI003314242C